MPAEVKKDIIKNNERVRDCPGAGQIKDAAGTSRRTGRYRRKTVMRTGLKRGLVLGLTACMAVTSLAGCSKSKSGADASATIATLDGEKIDAGVANFFLRYQQAEFESSYGTFLKSYYGTDIWNADLTSSGIPYGETFKQEIMTSLEKMLLAEKHMGDYGVELTDEDKAAITQAAKDFIAANGEEVLEKMNATQENVERVLTLYTIQKKMEPQMSADVDTEVSDEEAAQRTVSYVRFTAQTEAETEAESETETDTEEVSTEAGSEASETESELPAETQAESETEKATEKDTEAALTETSAAKTGAADKAETESETETAAETESEAVTEASTESGSEVSTEAESETETETETETEDPAMAAAKEKARAEAEAFLADVKGQDDFAAAAAEIAETSDSIATSSYTFGDDDTYPDSAIISATKGLEDDTLVDEVIEVSNSYYVLHVDDAFNEEATDNKKTEIVNQRKTDAINALYDEWISAAEFTIDEEELGKLAFDLSLMLETEAQTEAATEAATETESETGAETETEAVTEKETETESEAVTEAAETETVTEAVAETETEKAAKKAEKIAETETETEVKKAETKTAGKTSAK